jgi:two-component system, chemotaxis family, response regulator Rcp1
MTELVKIMLVEDNPGDRELTRLAMTRLKFANELIMAEDGEEALEILDRPEAGRPHLILLDLNMPGMDGMEFLTRVKAHAVHKTIPVIVLTSSGAHDDIDGAYRRHCAGYIRKPVDLAGLTKIVQAIDGYWFAIVDLPS